MTTTRLSILASTMLLSLGVTVPGHAQQAPNMTFFVTSVGSGKGGDLGGLDGADAHCQQLAATAGAGSKTWRAYLSTNAGAQAVPSMRATASARARGRTSRARSSPRRRRPAQRQQQAHERDRAHRARHHDRRLRHDPNWHDAMTGSTAEGRAFQAT